MKYTKKIYQKAKASDEFEFVCPECGQKFTKSKRYISKNKGIPKFCSKECAYKAKYKGLIEVTCQECGKTYTIAKSTFDKKIKRKENFFCCRSCSAKYNNKLYPKRKKIIKNIKDKKVIQSCRNFELGHYIGYDTKKSYLTHKCAQVRRDARRFMETISKQEKVCKFCGNHEFDDILEVHHLKGILEFDPHTKISEINSDENLIWLCPNHHAMLEKGLIKLK